jgi:uncharacterized protein YjiS (DUF1127 family)
MSHIDLGMRPAAHPSRAIPRATGRAGSTFRPSAARPASPTAQALHRALETVFAWTERARMRRRLLTLDDRLLRDMGLTHAQVHGEAEKPFWRV